MYIENTACSQTAEFLYMRLSGHGFEPVTAHLASAYVHVILSAYHMTTHLQHVHMHAGHANGSNDRLVANIDAQAREVEEGISAALAGSVPLLSVVIRDAAASSETISPVSTHCRKACLHVHAAVLRLLPTWAQDAANEH